MKRIVDEEGRDRTGELLASLPPLPSLTPAARARIRAGVAVGAGGRRWQPALALSLSAALLVGGALFLGARRPALPQVALPEARRATKRAPLALGAGTLRVVTGDEPAVVEDARARVVVRPHSTAEIRGSGRLVVAAFSGSAEVAWLENGRTVELQAGQRFEEDPPSPTSTSTPTPTSTPTRARTIPTPPREIAPIDPPVKLPLDDDSPPSPEDPLRDEANLVARAIERLRRGHDPAAALALLDEWRARFPEGTLAPEVELARVDALLALGQRAAALEVLDRAQLAGGPRAIELQVARGELRAEAGRFLAAIADFDAALGGARGLVEERARYGRAVCRARAGDPVAARRELTDYLQRFPAGRFAADARRAMKP